MRTLVIWLLMAVCSAWAEQPINFDTQIIPVLTKAGCNSGACHGAAVGRGGFKLSLYGGEPASDYQSIALQLGGRRINLSRPESSLLLLKPTESLAHGGGYVLEDESPGADLLRRWVQQGAQRAETSPRSDFSVSPRRYVADLNETVHLTATATFSDGRPVDVTDWTVLTPEDSSAVEVDTETGRAKLLRRGRHIIVARYLQHVVPIELLVPLAEEELDLGDQPRKNFVDDHVLRQLSTLRIPPSPAADDAAWLRRLTLDLTGRLPSPETLSAFLNEQRSDKREQQVERLLESDEFTLYWTSRLAELLRIQPQPQDNQGAATYHVWLYRQLDERVPYDQIARELITAVGDSHEFGPANFFRTVAGAREQAEFTSELFMGSRLRCANCHNHPLDRWTQDDYHGLAAIFAKVEPGRVVKPLPGGQVSHPRTGEAALPRLPGERFLDGSDERQELADWLTDADNPYFAKAAVNRFWKALMGRGLVEPTDDLRSTNPATHPELLDELARDFVDHGYDVRHTLRTIALSTTYGRQSQPLPENRDDDRFYSHALLRPLPPSVLADAIYDVTGVAERYGDEPLGTRAISLVDPTVESETLDVLGRCSRQESCETAGDASGGGLPRMLHLFNGPMLNRRVEAEQGRLAQWLADGLPPLEIVQRFYVIALSREASAAEVQFWGEQLLERNARQSQAILEDFLWGLLACREFVSNH